MVLANVEELEELGKEGAGATGAGAFLGCPSGAGGTISINFVLVGLLLLRKRYWLIGGGGMMEMDFIDNRSASGNAGGGGSDCGGGTSGSVETGWFSFSGSEAESSSNAFAHSKWRNSVESLGSTSK